MGAQRIDRHRPLTNEQIARPVHHQHRLLIDVLDRNEPHRGSRHSFADRRRIRRIVLVALDIGLPVGRRHQLDLMAQCDQLARPMVRRRARFHADQTRLLSAEERDDFRAAKPALDDDLSGSVDPMNLKPVLGEIETNCDRLHGGPLLSIVAFTDDHVVAHRCRGAGAVHPIKFRRP
jgi:hypothetical protein